MKGCGYVEALFYDNFGKAIKLVNINNDNDIRELISNIDNININYYDVLTYHKNNDRYAEVLKSELSLFYNA